MEIRLKVIRLKAFFLKPSLCLLSVIINLEGYLGVKSSRVCRVKRMTCRLKCDRGSSAVHPRSLRAQVAEMAKISLESAMNEVLKQVQGISPKSPL